MRFVDGAEEINLMMRWYWLHNLSVNGSVLDSVTSMDFKCGSRFRPRLLHHDLPMLEQRVFYGLKRRAAP